MASVALAASCLARVVVPGVLQPHERALLAGKIEYKSFTDLLIGPVVDAVLDRYQVDLEDPSYVRVECRKEGHAWHLDNGKHMPWCEVSGSVLLTECPPSGVGGVLEFEDETPTQRPGDLWLWDMQAENKHRVSRHDGWRICLLIFLQARDVAA